MLLPWNDAFRRFLHLHHLPNDAPTLQRYAIITGSNEESGFVVVRGRH
jgi:hypothetical protein